MNVRLSGTVMTPNVEVVGAGRLDERHFMWSWNRRHRTRARIVISEKDIANPFSRYEQQAIRRAIVKLDKDPGKTEQRARAGEAE